MIYLHEFRKLPVNKQYYILDKCGIELSALFNRQECKLLFSLDNFYVEIVYLRSSSEIKSLFSFSDVDRLEPYLDQINAKSSELKTFAYPNPIKDSRIFIKLPEKESGIVNYSLKNSSGFEIEKGKTQLFDDDKADLNLNAFDRMLLGTYYITVQSANGTYTLPLIKK